MLTAFAAAGALAAVPTGTAAALADTDATILRLIMEYRAANGLPDLPETPALSVVASNWSQSMAAVGGLSHNPAAAAQYGGPVDSSGEIVGFAAASGKTQDELAARIVQGWINSPGHRAIMLGSDWNQIGIGSVSASDGRLYATGNFILGAVQAPVAPVPQVEAGPDTPLSAAGAEALALSREMMAEGASPRIVISRDDLAVDALAGSGLSGQDSPVFFVAQDQPIAGAVIDEVARISNAQTTVYLLGGGISDGASQQIAQTGARPVRMAGSSRYETASMVAQEVMAVRGAPYRFHLVRADEWADAVSIAGQSSTNGLPILLLDRDGVPTATAQALQSAPGADRLLVGGTAAVSDATLRASGARRLTGADRSETGANVMRHQWAQAPAAGRHLVFTPGWAEDGWATALAYSAYAARHQAPLLFVGDNGVPDPVRTVLAEQRYTAATAPTLRFATGVTSAAQAEIRALTAN